MSVIYWLVIDKIGIFGLGRFVDLLQADITIMLLAAILVMEVKRWLRIRRG